MNRKSQKGSSRNFTTFKQNLRTTILPVVLGIFLVSTPLLLVTNDYAVEQTPLLAETQVVTNKYVRPSLQETFTKTPPTSSPSH